MKINAVQFFCLLAMVALSGVILAPVTTLILSFIVFWCTVAAYDCKPDDQALGYILAAFGCSAFGFIGSLIHLISRLFT